MQTEGRAIRSQSYTAHAVQLKDHSRYDTLDIHCYVPITIEGNECKLVSYQAGLELGW